MRFCWIDLKKAHFKLQSHRNQLAGNWHTRYQAFTVCMEDDGRLIRKKWDRLKATHKSQWPKYFPFTNELMFITQFFMSACWNFLIALFSPLFYKKWLQVILFNCLKDLKKIGKWPLQCVFIFACPLALKKAGAYRLKMF